MTDREGDRDKEREGERGWGDGTDRMRKKREEMIWIKGKRKREQTNSEKMIQWRTGTFINTYKKTCLVFHGRITEQAVTDVRSSFYVGLILLIKITLFNAVK